MLRWTTLFSAHTGHKTGACGTAISEMYSFGQSMCGSIGRVTWFILWTGVSYATKINSWRKLPIWQIVSISYFPVARKESSMKREHRILEIICKKVCHTVSSTIALELASSLCASHRQKRSYCPIIQTMYTCMSYFIRYICPACRLECVSQLN